MWSAALKRLIEGDVPFCSKLARWNFGDGTQRPAIFLGESPLDCGSPRVEIDIGGAGTEGTRGYMGGVHILEVTLWGDRSKSKNQLEIHAYELWKLISRKRLCVDGYRVTPLIVTPPTAIFDGDSFPGYSMDMEFTFMEGW